MYNQYVFVVYLTYICHISLSLMRWILQLVELRTNAANKFNTSLYFTKKISFLKSMNERIKLPTLKSSHLRKLHKADLTKLRPQRKTQRKTKQESRKIISRKIFAEFAIQDTLWCELLCHFFHNKMHQMCCNSRSLFLLGTNVLFQPQIEALLHFKKCI